MYMPSKLFASTKFVDDVYITEYFPISNRNNHGVIIPLYQNGAVPGVFQEVIKKYNFINNQCCTPIQNPDKILSKDEYIAELNGLINRMNQLHNGTVSFVTRDVNIMYETYRSLNSSKWVAGLISIVRSKAMNPVKDMTVIPPEGTNMTIGFETYVASLKRNLPLLTLDYYTASNMYSMYLEQVALKGSTITEIPFLINCPGLQQLVQAIGVAGPNLTAQVIMSVIVERTMSDDILSNYYDNMQRMYGVRERIAKALLNYHPSMVNNTIAGLRHSIGMLSEREVVWSKTPVVSSIAEKYADEQTMMI